MRCAYRPVVLATALASFMALCGAAAGAATPGAGQDEDRSCPPALVDCATWSVPADAAAAAWRAETPPNPRKK